MFIRWGNGADKTGILSVTDENGTGVVRLSLDSENDYTLVENLVPGTAYHVALLKSDDAVLWKDDVKTKSVTGKFPLLKYQQVDELLSREHTSSEKQYIALEKFTLGKISLEEVMETLK